MCLGTLLAEIRVVQRFWEEQVESWVKASRTQVVPARMLGCWEGVSWVKLPCLDRERGRGGHTLRNMFS